MKAYFCLTVQQSQTGGSFLGDDYLPVCDHCWFLLDLDFFPPWSAIWTENDCQTRFLLAFVIWDQNTDWTWHQSHNCRAERKLVNIQCYQTAQIYHGEAEEGLSQCRQTCWPTYTWATTQEMANKLFTKSLEWLKEHICCCLSTKKIYTLHYKIQVPHDPVLSTMSICSRCGKD